MHDLCEGNDTEKYEIYVVYMIYVCEVLIKMRNIRDKHDLIVRDDSEKY